MLYFPGHDISVLTQLLKDVHNLCLPLLVEYAKGTEVRDALDEWVGEELTRGGSGRGVFCETLGENIVELLGPVGRRCMEVWGYVKCGNVGV